MDEFYTTIHNRQGGGAIFMELVHFQLTFVCARSALHTKRAAEGHRTCKENPYLGKFVRLNRGFGSSFLVF